MYGYLQPPVPAGPWTGIRDGSIEGKSCIQPAFDSPDPTTGDEDCLTLSVFTPEVSFMHFCNEIWHPE